MASLGGFWRLLLRAVGIGRHGGHRWVEPSNAVTRAIARGETFATMATWQEPNAAFAPAPPAPMESAPVTAEPVGEDGATPKRPGVAA